MKLLAHFRHAAVMVALLFGAAGLASAEPLIGFIDGATNSFAYAFLSDRANWAVSWTQTVSSSNVTLRAVMATNIGPTSANWYVTKSIGAGTTVADVVYSGTYNLTFGAGDNNFNDDPRTLLGAGLDFDPGTYYLVLDGPSGQFLNNANWIGDVRGVSTTLAPGFSIGAYAGTAAADSFAPASTFVTAQQGQFVFEMASEDLNRVPLPSTLALLGAGLIAAWLARRQRSDECH